MGNQNANQARLQKSANYVKQVIVVDADWQVRRLDALNWEIRYQNQFKGYYGNPIAAFQALPVKMLTAVATGDLKQILEQQAQINRVVEASLKPRTADVQPSSIK